MKSALKLSKKRIESLLKKLNRELELSAIKGELYLVGGAVMCLAFNARSSTRDLDAFFVPSKEIRRLAKKIAQSEKLPDAWLNYGVKAFFSEEGSFNLYVEHSHLKVHVATAEYLLAMKCMSMRLGEEFEDLNDVIYLLRYLNLETLAQAIQVITNYYPQDQFPPKTFFALEELLS